MKGTISSSIFPALIRKGQINKKVPKRKSFTAQSGSRTSSKPIIVVVRRTYAFGTYWKKCDRSVTPKSRDWRKKKRDLEAFDLEVVGWMVVWFGPFGIVWGSGKKD